MATVARIQNGLHGGPPRSCQAIHRSFAERDRRGRDLLARRDEKHNGERRGQSERGAGRVGTVYKIGRSRRPGRTGEAVGSTTGAEEMTLKSRIEKMEARAGVGV